MYPNLYKGLNLKPKDLTTYDSPLVSFDRKVVIPKGYYIARASRFRGGGSRLHFPSSECQTIISRKQPPRRSSKEHSDAAKEEENKFK